MNQATDGRAESFRDSAQPPDVNKTANNDEPDPESVAKALDDITTRIGALEDNKELRDKATVDVDDYVKSLKEDLASIKQIRFGSVCVSIIYVFAVNVALLVLIFWFQTYFEGLCSYTQIFMIAITISSTIGLLIAILKGAFKSYGERYKVDYVPPHLQKVLDALLKAREEAGSSG